MNCSEPNSISDIEMAEVGTVPKSRVIRSPTSRIGRRRRDVRAAHFWIKQILEKSFQVPDAVPALFIVDH